MSGDTPGNTPGNTIACWAVKGGSGTTATAVALASTASGYGLRTLLVDLAGDCATVCGRNVGSARSIDAWIDAAKADGAQVEPSALSALMIDLAGGLTLLPSTRSIVARSRVVDDAVAALWAVLASWIRSQRSEFDLVVIDGGTFGTNLERVIDHRRELVASIGQSLLVTRACFLSLQAAVAEREAPWKPDGVVLVRELGRALHADDIEAALGTRVIATVDVEASVARAADAGVLHTRLPRQLARSLRHLVPSGSGTRTAERARGSAVGEGSAA